MSGIVNVDSGWSMSFKQCNSAAMFSSHCTRSIGSNSSYIHDADTVSIETTYHLACNSSSFPILHLTILQSKLVMRKLVNACANLKKNVALILVLANKAKMESHVFSVTNIATVITQYTDQRAGADLIEQLQRKNQ
jgi:hypothetical protein